jgi:hypothetical protein
VEFFHTHTDCTKVLGGTSWGGKAFTLAGEGLLLCKGKYKLGPRDYDAI